MSNRVAVFDVDGTLLRGDCLWLAARRARSPIGQLVAAVACLPQVIGWQLRLVSTGRFKQTVIAAFGICEAVNRASALGKEPWLLDQLKEQIRPEALVQLRQHQQWGYGDCEQRHTCFCHWCRCGHGGAAKCWTAVKPVCAAVEPDCECDCGAG